MKTPEQIRMPRCLFNYFIINFRIIQLTTPATQIGSNVFFKLP